MPQTAPIDPDLIRFLTRLKKNNNRPWFQKHKQEYEAVLRDPLLQFIRDFEPKLEALNPNLVADDRPVGGSLFRIYRDTRFSADKRPYKTWAAMRFRHRSADDGAAPGFYLHIEPANTFAGCGIWHPDAPALAAIRQAIVDDPHGWKKAISGQAFRSTFDLAGDALKRAPRGYDPEHPFIEDLKRKDFVAVSTFSEKELQAPGFLNEYARRLRLTRPFMAFLARAVGVPW